MKKEDFIMRDRLLRAITTNGHFRISIVKTTDVVRTARQRHGLSLLNTVLLGRTLTGSLLLASRLKGDERIQVRIEGSGPVRSVTAEATSHGEVRGYVSHPGAELDFQEDTRLGDAIGAGVMSVSKSLYNLARPVTGTVALVRGNVNEDLAHYLLQSEQIPSAVSLDVAIDEKGDVTEAGGVLVQALPGAEREDVERLEENVRSMSQPGKQLQAGYLDDVLSAVSKGMAVKELGRYPVDFFCRCSKGRFRDSLALLDPDELLKMQSETEELVCHYCSKKYVFSRQEIDAIAQKAKVRQN
ncbi:MAG: Hsp33 family molecular chaperone HslO [Cyclonatronaceae bacterium]